MKWRVPQLVDEWDFEELALNMESLNAKLQNKHGVIFVAWSKLIAFYWKTWTFHGFGQMCLSEVLCLMMLKLGGPSRKSQQLTQLQLISEAHVACTFLWDQQRSLLSKWLGGLWSIDLLNLGWFIVLVSRNTDFAGCPSYHFVPDDLKNIWESERNRDDELSLVFDIKVWKWNCLRSGATS